MAPPRMMKREQTVAKTGRWIKKSTNKAGFRPRLSWSAAVHAVYKKLLARSAFGVVLNLLGDGHPVLQELRAGNNDVVPGFQAIQHGEVVRSEERRVGKEWRCRRLLCD